MLSKPIQDNTSWAFKANKGNPPTLIGPYHYNPET